jgi:hypothetical protein
MYLLRRLFRADAKAGSPDVMQERRPSMACAVLYTVIGGFIAVAAMLLAARGPALAMEVEKGLRGIRATLVMSAVIWSERCALLFILVWLVHLWLNGLLSRYRLFRKEIVMMSGVFIRTEKTIPVAQVRKIEIRRSPAGLLLDYGDVFIDDGTAQPPVAWRMPSPDSFVSAIRFLQEESPPVVRAIECVSNGAKESHPGM